MANLNGVKNLNSSQIRGEFDKRKLKDQSVGSTQNFFNTKLLKNQLNNEKSSENDNAIDSTPDWTLNLTEYARMLSSNQNFFGELDNRTTNCL